MSPRARQEKGDERRSLVPLGSEPVPLIALAGHIANEKVRFEPFCPAVFLFEGDSRREKALPDGRTRPGKRREDGLDDTSINARIRLLGRLIGIKNLSPHALRHSWATEHAQRGVNVKDLQQAGGWSSPYMPLQYVQDSEIANEGLINHGTRAGKER